MSQPDQAEINEREWRDAENWHGGIFGVYRSARDSRVFVRKRTPWMGWTLNFARPQAALYVIGFLAFVATLVVLAIVLAR